MKALQGKTILVTGASGGIGGCIAEELARNGANVLLVGRDEVSLDSVRARIVANGGHAQVVAADLLVPEDRQRIIQMCLSLPNGLYGLINNAGINHFAWLEDQTETMLHAQIHLNLVAPILLTRALLPVLSKDTNARILNIGSTFGSIGYPGYTAYCASKFGLRGFSEALRRELAQSDIRVLYFAPRATRTALNSDPVVAMNNALGNAMDAPEIVAKKVVALFIKGAPSQYFFGWPESLFVRINALLPRVVDQALGKQLAIIRKHAGR
ncbi:MAG: SDR family oxidoreductase [Pseudomonadales bacterium]